MDCYNDFALIYDRLMSEDIDYGKIADYIQSIYKKYSVPASLCLDLACGTGSLTKILSDRGYEMIGIDISEDMLNIAKAKDEKTLYLCQDMRSFELYGSVSAITCMTDSFNYILDDSDLLSIFKSAKTCYLDSGAPLIFDMNSPYKLKNIIASNTFIHNEDDIFYSWENQYDKKEDICDFFLTFFVKEGEKYRRFDEVHSQKARSASLVSNMLFEAGFRFVDVYDEYSFDKANDKTERFMFVAR